MTARDVADIFESVAPISSGVPGDQMGFIWGENQLHMPQAAMEREPRR